MKYKLVLVVDSIQIITSINFSYVFGRRKCEHHQRKSAGYLWPGSHHLLQKLLFEGNWVFFFFFCKTTFKHYSQATVCFLNLFYDFHHAVILSSTVIWQIYTCQRFISLHPLHALHPTCTHTHCGDNNFTYIFTGTILYFFDKQILLVRRYL